MSKYYRKVTCLLSNVPILFYLKPFIYILEKPINGTRFFYSEILINDPENKIKFNELSNEEFTKYTNNSSYSINDLIASFSHFSFDAS